MAGNVQRPPEGPDRIVEAAKDVGREALEQYQQDAVFIAKKAIGNVVGEALHGKRLAEARKFVNAVDRSCGGVFSTAAREFKALLKGG